MHTKILLSALVLVLAPIAAGAQTAAPAAQNVPPRGVNPAVGPAPGQVIQMPVPPAGEEQKAEAALTTTIAAFEAGKPNWDDMEGALQSAAKQQGDALAGAFKSLGTLKTLEYQGYDPHGVWKYRGQFANGQADLMIGFGPTGKIQTLWFKPVAA